MINSSCLLKYIYVFTGSDPQTCVSQRFCRLCNCPNACVVIGSQVLSLLRLPASAIHAYLNIVTGLSNKSPLLLVYCERDFHEHLSQTCFSCAENVLGTADSRRLILNK